jgi:hypothetical protein
MSGGSYEYLCLKSIDELFNRRDLLEAMASRLTELGARDAAEETEEILSIFNHFERRMNVRIKRLSDLWRAVEWFDSCDIGQGQLDNSIDEYRAEVEPAGK